MDLRLHSALAIPCENHRATGPGRESLCSRRRRLDLFRHQCRVKCGGSPGQWCDSARLRYRKPPSRSRPCGHHTFSPFARSERDDALSGCHRPVFQKPDLLSVRKDRGCSREPGHPAFEARYRQRFSRCCGRSVHSAGSHPAVVMARITSSLVPTSPMLRGSPGISLRSMRDAGVVPEVGAMLLMTFPKARKNNIRGDKIGRGEREYYSRPGRESASRLGFRTERHMFKTRHDRRKTHQGGYDLGPIDPKSKIVAVQEQTTSLFHDEQRPAVRRCHAH